MHTPDFDFPEGHVMRRGRLTASGIIFGLMGGLCLIFFALIVFSMSMMNLASASAGSSGAAELDQMESMLFKSNLINLIIYGGGAIYLIAIAYGSIFLRRWSRPLALTTSWLVLYTGVISLASLFWMAPAMKEMMSVAPPTPPASGGTVPVAPPPVAMDGFFSVFLAVMITFVFVFLILLPILLLWLNWHRDVRVTLEFCDRKPRWTDRGPIPAVAISIVAMLGAISMLMMLIIPWMPFFGRMLTGNPARLLVGVITLWLLFIALTAYRRKLSGWIAAIVLLSVSAVSYWLSAPQMDFREMYVEMGMPSEAVDEMMGPDNPTGKLIEATTSMGVFMLLGFAPLVAYLIWAFQFFRPSSPPLPSPEAT